MWQQWINAILGLGVIAVPFLDLSATTLTWTLAVAGIAIAALSVWAAMREQTTEYHQESLRELTQS